MCLSLVWLTVSLPYVFDSQLKYAAIAGEQNEQSSFPFGEEEIPLTTNTSEEKAPTVITGQEEYLHHENENHLLGSQFLSHISRHNPSIYIAFYGELISPPPDCIS